MVRAGDAVVSPHAVPIDSTGCPGRRRPTSVDACWTPGVYAAETLVGRQLRDRRRRTAGDRWAARGDARVAAPAQRSPADRSAAVAVARTDAGRGAGHRLRAVQPRRPALPAVPAGAVKVFKVDVFHHVTQVAKDARADRGLELRRSTACEHRGSGASPPMVVNEGDTVDFTLANGSTTSMKVNLPHSLDFHSAEVDPGTRYGDLAPGKSMHYRFTADHPGVFMYHCATQPVLMHTGAGMSGMFVVKPKGLPRSTVSCGPPSRVLHRQARRPADMTKLRPSSPTSSRSTGTPTSTRTRRSVRRRAIRMYVLNAGPSVWSAFHVIGTVFDRVHTDNGVGARRTDDQPRAEPGRLGRVHPRRGGLLPVRHPCVRRHGQGRARRAEDVARPAGHGHCGPRSEPLKVRRRAKPRYPRSARTDPRVSRGSRPVDRAHGYGSSRVRACTTARPRGRSQRRGRDSNPR